MPLDDVETIDRFIVTSVWGETIDRFMVTSVWGLDTVALVVSFILESIKLSISKYVE